MNFVDIFLLLILILGAVRGYSKGLIIELFSLLAFFIGLFVAIEFSGPVSAVFFGDSDFFTLAVIGAFILLFITTSMVINLLARFIKKGVDLVFLGWFDNLLGGVLGIVKWAFLISILILMVSAMGLNLPQKELNASRIYPYVEPVGRGAFRIMESILPSLHDFMDSVKGLKEKERFV